MNRLSLFSNEFPLKWTSFYMYICSNIRDRGGKETKDEQKKKFPWKQIERLLSRIQYFSQGYVKEILRNDFISNSPPPFADTLHPYPVVLF